MDISVREYVTSVQGKDFLLEDEKNKWNLVCFVDNIVRSLPINANKCKEVNIEIYKIDEKVKVNDINLTSPLLNVCVLVDRFNKVLKFNGIDCVSEHLDEDIKKEVQTEWRKLLIAIYDNEKDITRILSARKQKRVYEIIREYNSEIEDLYNA